MGQSKQVGIEPEKPLAWHRDQPGWTPLLLRIVRLSRSRPQRRASETTRKGSLWHRKAPGRWGGPLGSWHRNLVHSERGDVGPRDAV